MDPPPLHTMTDTEIVAAVQAAMDQWEESHPRPEPAAELRVSL